MAATRLLHILKTAFVGEGEVLVQFSDGSTAIYDGEELEKLRPRQKDMSQRMSRPVQWPTGSDAA